MISQKTIDAARLCLSDYVREHLQRDIKAGRNMYKCPFCFSGYGVHGSGAFSITPAGDAWRCFACGRGGDVFDLVGELESIPGYPERVARVASLYGLTVEEATPRELVARSFGDPTQEQMQEREKEPAPAAVVNPAVVDYVTRCEKAAGLTSYFTGRGLSADTVRRFRLGYDAAAGCVVLPYDAAGAYYITRSIDGKQYKKPPAALAGSEPLFNVAALYSGAPVFVCEGPFDALAIEQAGGRAVSLGGLGGSALLAAIRERKPPAPLLLCLDNDEPGEKAAARLASDLDRLGVKYARAAFSLDKYGAGPFKDPGELLQADPEQLAADVAGNVAANLEPPQTDAPPVALSVADYFGRLYYDSALGYFAKYKDRKTGFSGLDKYLTLYPGLCVLGGSASLGKTTFCVNVADNLIQAGETVLYFTLEQEPVEIITKLLARRRYALDPETAPTNTAIKNGLTDATLEKIKLDFTGAAASRFILWRCDFTITAAGIRDAVAGYMSQNPGKKPVVIIDYLQLISPPPSFRGDQRAGVDSTIKELKTMQRDFELFVLLVSSFNRSSYTEPVTYESFKESGLIEYTADYVLGLQLAILESPSFYRRIGALGGSRDTTRDEKTRAIYDESRNTPKAVEVVALKNRNGKQTFKAFFNYWPQFDTFKDNPFSNYDPERFLQTDEKDRPKEQKTEEGTKPESSAAERARAALSGK